MLDFLMISTRTKKNGPVEIYPRFIIKRSNDLMIRGSDFYAIWVEELGLWSTDEHDVIRLVDQELEKYAEKNRDKFDSNYKILYMWDAETGMIDSWHKYCQKQMRDSFHMLDEKLIFSNAETNKKDYASKRLNYPLEAGSIEAYDRLMSVLYSEEERRKIEWAIGAIVSGDSKKIQKFMVLYGAAGTGKSTVLNIIQQLFEGYYSVFDAKALGSSSNSFALEAFKTNPLVAIQHDGDLSKIEDNTRLNSLVSHELMTINEKFKSTYSNRFKCFLFMGTNKPVKITDGKSGLIRRLIDVVPSGNKLSAKEYKQITKQISFELGAIAHHCKEVYLEDPGRYDDYMPIAMMGASNDFYNYVLDAYHIFKREDGTTLKAAWEMYKTYCEEAKVSYPLSQRNFKEELKNYFWEFSDRFNLDEDTRVRSYYSGFRLDKFETKTKKKKEESKSKLIQFDAAESIFDKECAEYPAQYATAQETPKKAWDKVTTKLKDIDTSKLHYVKVPINHIVIDFDIKGPDGKKSFERNLEEASKWPATYAELSKSGAGIHLHYIYTGDPMKLSRVYDDNIEVKVFSGGSALRRKLTKCNNLPIATISSGLPLKGEDKVINWDGIKNEKMLRTMIKRDLNKEYHSSTASSISHIHKILNDAYNSGIGYDVSDLENVILAFAANSTNQSSQCIKLVNEMKFKSEEPCVSGTNVDDERLVFYDVEVFPNLFLVNWKYEGEKEPVVRMINPTPSDIEGLLHFKLVGFNCRRYDNHILYARLMGYDNEQLYKLSQKIIGGEKGRSSGLFGEAYNLSYTDIYDFASAGNKKSLKKLEIEMGTVPIDKLKKNGFSDEEIRIIKKGAHHKELGLPWDQPVPEEKWIEVAKYCDNDVFATEAAFVYLKGDWVARQILADLANMTYNDSTNSLTTRFIFGNERKPQSQFNYRNLAEPVYELDEETLAFLKEACPEMMSAPHGEKKSLLPYFEDYKYEFGKSTYRGEEVGEGGYVYAEPGMYTNAALLDIMSMHPHSTIAECLFGPKFTKAFKEIVDGRVDIKHEAWEQVNQILDGKLTPYIQKVLDGEMTAKDLANALKTAINAVYGQTFASYDNPFRDPRNKDNIVAKRGALFMVDLKNEVQARGFTVIHCKTDSIKIADATQDIIDFVMEYGKRYGYYFEHEATYSKICLVNDAVYIAKDGEEWTATGKQFAVPYVHKTLFSGESIEFDDMCETIAVSKGDLYLDMNENLPDVSGLEKDLEKLVKLAKKSGVELDISGNSGDAELDPMIKQIAEGHNYIFVGRVGRFCPIKDGGNGGVLYRVNDGKYYAAAGTKGYRWLESEMVKELGKEDSIDRSYYDKLVDDAVETISEFGDFEWFVSDDAVAPVQEDTPPWTTPCGDGKYETCFDCPHFYDDNFHMGCGLNYDISNVITLKTKK